MPKPPRKLHCYYNWLSREGLTCPSEGWLPAIQRAGYDGIQLVEPLEIDLVSACRDLGLGVCGCGRVNTPDDAMRLAEQGSRFGLECVTLHVGWGMEDDEYAGKLIEAVLAASEQSSLQLYIETQRATVFQDMWRTVQFIRRYPEVRLNGDFSHWYTGLEMVYGGFEKKLEFIQPVIERVRFLHGRIGNPGCMQVDIGDVENACALPYVLHFTQIWTAVFAAWMKQEHNSPVFCFTTELLAPDIYYARLFRGHEESDRWQQSLVLAELARRCFANAQKQGSGIGLI